LSAEEDRQQVTAPPDARREIEGLVQRFDRNLDVYTRPQYKEAQARPEFFDPFFEAPSIPADKRLCSTRSRPPMGRSTRWCTSCMG